MRGGQQQDSNKSLDFFLIVALIAVTIGGLWYFHHAAIVYGLFRFRLLQGESVLFLVDALQDVIHSLGFGTPNLDNFELAMEYMSHADTDQINLNQLNSISIFYGGIFVFISAFLGILSGVYMMMFNALTRYRSTYTMSLFCHAESSNWASISPILDKNLVKASLVDGPWAMSLRPLDFAKMHGLVYEGSTSDGKAVARLKRGEAYQIFCLQMGPLWVNLEGLPPYVLALFACFAAKGNGDNKGMRRLLNQIARSTETGHLDFGGTRELLVKHVQDPRIGRAVSPHAYLYTVMASLLLHARGDGVLATAEFIWLKPLDRRLWYVLNSVGRQTPFCEVAGPIAHLKIEDRLRRAIKVPMVGEAVNALEAALGDIIYQAGDK